MIPPFTPQQFIEVFVRYNEAVWPAQLALNGVALAVLALLFAPPGRAIAALLAVLWAWTGIAYHFLFFFGGGGGGGGASSGWGDSASCWAKSLSL